MKKIIVLGCGIIELTSAISILLDSAKNKVLIYAEYLPSDNESNGFDYCSSKAGAYWNSFARKEDTFQKEIDFETFKILLDSSKNKNSGIIIDRFYQYYRDKNDYIKPWFVNNDMFEYDIIDEKDLPENISF